MYKYKPYTRLPDDHQINYLPKTVQLGDLTVILDYFREDDITPLFEILPEGKCHAEKISSINELKAILAEGIAFSLRIPPIKRSNASINKNTEKQCCLLGAVLITKCMLARALYFNIISRIVIFGDHLLNEGERLKDTVIQAERLAVDVNLGYRIMTCLVHLENKSTLSSLQAAGMEITAKFPEKSSSSLHEGKAYDLGLMFKYLTGVRLEQVSCKYLYLIKRLTG